MLFEERRVRGALIYLPQSEDSKWTIAGILEQMMQRSIIVESDSSEVAIELQCIYLSCQLVRID